MSRKNRVRLPASEGGLVRYYDDAYQSKVVLSPHSVIVLIIAIAIASVAIRFF